MCLLPALVHREERPLNSGIHFSAQCRVSALDDAHEAPGLGVGRGLEEMEGEAVIAEFAARHAAQRHGEVENPVRVHHADRLGGVKSVCVRARTHTRAQMGCYGQDESNDTNQSGFIVIQSNTADSMPPHTLDNREFTLVESRRTNRPRSM